MPLIHLLKYVSSTRHRAGAGETVLNQTDTPTCPCPPGTCGLVGETDVQRLRCNWSFCYDNVMIIIGEERGARGSEHEGPNLGSRMMFLGRGPSGDCSRYRQG